MRHLRRPLTGAKLHGTGDRSWLRRGGLDTGAALAGRVGFSVTFDLLTIGRRFSLHFRVSHCLTQYFTHLLSDSPDLPTAKTFHCKPSAPITNVQFKTD